MPYTIQQVEDVMFIDNTKLISLEYIYYSMDENAKYSKVTPKKNDNKYNGKLGVKDFVEKMHANNQNVNYKNMPHMYANRPKDYLQEKHIHKIQEYNGST